MKMRRVLELVSRKCHLKYKISFSNKTLTSNFPLYKNMWSQKIIWCMGVGWGGGHARYHITLELLSTIKAGLSHIRIDNLFSKCELLGNTTSIFPGSVLMANRGDWIFSYLFKSIHNYYKIVCSKLRYSKNNSKKKWFSMSILLLLYLSELVQIEIKFIFNFIKTID